MPPVSIPNPLRTLLEASAKEEATTILLSEEVGTILSDNEMPFFPAFTDHGTAHVDGVLATALKLVPKEVWDANLLTAKDAAVLSCGAMLHDLAMHIREPGFVELVGADTRHTPLPWFSASHPGREADLPWPELWADFQREARHFGTGQLELILGPNASVPAVAHEVELDASAWVDADRLLIGEFLRRHHARLAHEIAHFGLPGVDVEDFPLLVKELGELGNAAGAVARSHNEPMRLMREYLQYLASGSKRPQGALLLYAMGLLRISDYLQIASDRAPLLLLRLKDPQSPRSVEEWKTHGAVSSIDWNPDDPLAIHVSVSPAHGLRTHLALDDLFADLQNELEATSAVLDSEFGAGELSALSLSKRRILTNLDAESLHVQLPYVPRRAALRSDPDLFRLVIGDLYGRQPAVAGRELIQNAVDAIRARRAHETRTGVEIPPGELRQLEADVVVALEEGDDGQCVLRVSDRGVGMKPDLVIDYFLQAGASFGPTRAELEELDHDEAVRTMKAGRFGVGAFAAFLLGPEIRVTTRHPEAERGLTFRARIDEDLVELKWTEAPVGTEVEVPFDAATLPPKRWGESDEPQAPERLLADIADFYRLSDPTIAIAWTSKAGVKQLDAPADVPEPKGKLPDRWRKVRAVDFEGVIWRVPKRDRYDAQEFLSEDGGALVHNGILIRELTDNLILDESAYEWSDRSVLQLLRRPSLAVFDSRHRLHVALHRYGLTDPTLPFERELQESIGSDLVAHALHAGARNHPLQDDIGFSGVYTRGAWMPLLPSLLERYLRAPLFVLWQYPHRGKRFPENSAGAKAFFKRDGTVPWRQIRHRAVLELDEPDPDIFEYEDWNESLDGIHHLAVHWAGVLNCKAIGTVAIRGDAPVHEASPPAPKEPSEWPGWRGVGPAQQEANAGIYLDGEQAENPPIEETLIAAATAFRAGGGRSVVMTAFGDFAQDRQADRYIADAWIRHLDGGIARGSRPRKETAESILASNQSLRALANKWGRTLQELG